MATRKRADCEEFGQSVRKRLYDLEMTQTELAALLGVSLANIHAILSGKRSGLKYREQIRTAIGMPSVRQGLNMVTNHEKFETAGDVNAAKQCLANHQ